MSDVTGAVALRTAGAPGWQYTEYQEDVANVTGATRKHKPGWYSKEPGKWRTCVPRTEDKKETWCEPLCYPETFLLPTISTQCQSGQP